MIAMDGCISWLTRSSRPIYSPDRKHAVEIVEIDQGALGGSTCVELYSDYGLHSDWIYEGDFYTVHTEDIRWVSNSEIEIHNRMYRPNDAPQLCEGARGIRVQCVSRFVE